MVESIHATHIKQNIPTRARQETFWTPTEFECTEKLTTLSDAPC